MGARMMKRAIDPRAAECEGAPEAMKSAVYEGM
jgi:hypothetical protein